MSKHQHLSPTLAVHKEIASAPFSSIATTRKLCVTFAKNFLHYDGKILYCND